MAPQLLKKNDLLWLLGWPVYQILGTVRHELSHAAAAVWQGANITKIEFLPSYQPEGFLWGYVAWTGGQTNALVMVAPYFCDFAVFLLFFSLCPLFARWPRWLWINCLILGMFSPLIDTAANYWKFLRRGSGDVNELAARYPPLMIHAIFLGVLIFYLVAIRFAWNACNRKSRANASDEATCDNR